MKKSRITIIIACVFITALVLIACAKTYTITFDPNGGSILSGESVQTVLEGEAATPPTPERRGYAFDGWEGDYSAVTGDDTVRAKWVPLYTVIFNPNGGTAADTVLLVQNVREGESAVLPEISREGYEFDGWSVENLTNIHSDLTVTANWTRVWTMRYILAGGDVTNYSLLNQTVREDQSPTVPKPTRDKFTFVEWTEHINEAEGVKTYTAVWEKTKYTASEISRLANAATAEITTYRPSGEEWALGSGFFINDSGLLITNYHVAKASSSMKVKVGNNTYDVSNVVDYNEAFDVAVLQVNTNGQKTAFLELNSRLPTVGDTVYAVGSSLGLTGTFSSGIVSYVNREVEGVKFIQTTAPISSGNSGGPLISEYGEVIGMNTATYTEGQNLNLAVPAKTILSVNNYKQYISLNAWFDITAEYYLPGDVVVPVDGDITICNNGYTYKGKTGTNTQIFGTKAKSSEQFIMFTITVDDYNQLSKLHYDIVSSQIRGDTLYYDTFSPTVSFMETEKLEDGSGVLVCMFQIPKNRLDKDHNYYGILIASTYTPIEYEYYSWVMSAEEMLEIEMPN